ncbi:MAG: DNA polymerase III subunit gamma and tau [Actinomycetota bacterium]|nr:DNA polymerase III subunit gamma and tau [Actinomycetota bacterium]
MSQALYRRYRPERFGDLIGQDHVTGPLQQALKQDRVHHAYLFSGPRGCGKTTSARILARCLNCEQGPGPEPCGQCQSCRDLARGGPGSIDVIEIDAASHGGVDDARDLRERAFYAPASSRFKIYIIDEAHMVSKEGFNALLKLVEEPPSHIKFVFATTEPDKVIGTIRSRTHHYPFRLVPSRSLETYLEEVCGHEGITVQPGVLPLVVRAGAGSVRDSLSVLDQLIGGSVDDEVTYEGTVQLLGFTPAALLDEFVDAFAASDGPAVFGAVDAVIDSGQEPRRFLEDVMQRLRDLVIVAAVPDAFSQQLVAAPDDQQERMAAQADRLGLPRLTHSTDLVATALTELRGATAPRLQLELVCAKLLLPAAGAPDVALGQRLDRLERRLQIAGDKPPPSPQPPPQSPQPPPQSPQPPSTPTATKPPAPAPQPPPTQEPGARAPSLGSIEQSVPTEPAGPPDPAPRAGAEGAPSGPETSIEASEGAHAPGNEGGMDLHEVRRLWPSVLDRVKEHRRAVWMMLFEKSQVMDIDASQLTIGLSDPGSVKAFASGGKDELVRQSVIDVLGVDVMVVAVLDPSGPGGAAAPAPVPQKPRAAKPVPASAAQARAEAAKVDGPAVGQGRASDPPVDESVDTDDADADDTGLSGHDLVAQQLGGKVIGEIEHD